MRRSNAEVKIGLALAGGGGKGAYQVGVWRALKELHIKPNVIAGSSVGALNGALICQGRSGDLENLWSTISFRRVYSFGWLTLPVLFFQFMYRILIWQMPVRGRLIYLLVIGTTDAVVLGILGVYVLSGQTLLWLWALCVLVFFGVLSLSGQVRGPRPFWSSVLLALSFAAGTSLLFDAATRPFPRPLPLWMTGLLVQMAILLVGEALAVASIAALDNAPLHKQIVELCDPEKIRAGTKLIATTAHVQGIFDPDLPDEYTLPWPLTRPRTLGIGRFRLKLPARSVFRNRLVPTYTDLGHASDGEIHDVLVQSAAIPHVFAARLLWGVSAVDGGVADNVPIKPLLDCGCTLIIVVHLNHKGLDKHFNLLQPEHLAARLKMLHRLGKLADRGADTLLQVYEAVYGPLATAASEKRRKQAATEGKWLFPQTYPGTQLPFGTFAPGPGGDSHIRVPTEMTEKDWPASMPCILHVVPSRSLGNFITGTMRFSAKKSRKNVELGYTDMLTYWQQYKALSVGSPIPAVGRAQGGNRKQRHKSSSKTR